ncbi:thiol oxidoreductase [Aquimarina atlantica]|uniref:Thiol oxidoreductase n=1 Tax=Aquimarina atlantica TaxID=1317122 RepID=A0A023BQM1_9FLAO|nr:di-heme oxidoredictase family protein [Aquimarina atlantica]EZH72229.1 thiol oxidoreductase [Aquimarina atlantica]
MKKKFLYVTLFSFYLLSFFGCSDDEYTDPTPTNQAVYEDGEEFLAGRLTINSQTSNAFGRAIPGLSDEEQIFFGIGNSLFNQAWVSSPASTTARDGLGPTFNSRACTSCHSKDGRGLPITENILGSNGFLMRISMPGIGENGGPNPVTNYGTQIQDKANSGILHEAKIRATYEIIEGSYSDGETYTLQKPIYEIYDEQFGSLQDVLTSPRVGTQTIGMGLIDALPEASILAHADEHDADNDGISGKPNYVWDVKENQLRLGKYGWKANQPSLEQQVFSAFHGDMGLTTSFLPENNCPTSQVDCMNAANGGEPEVTDLQLERVVFYQRTLGVPIRRNFKDENVLKGKVLFNDLQCISCHQTKYIAGNSPSTPLIEGVVFNPYSDFLLHDMGEALADNRSDFKANGREWRTQPLWGIGLIKTINNHTFFLHDGRARNIEEAILWHGGEAENSLNEFKKLPKSQRQELIAFINSL